MNIPVKTGYCQGCRARSTESCLGCSYMKEGYAAQENVEALLGPINFTEEGNDADSTHEQERESTAGDTRSAVSPAG